MENRVEISSDDEFDIDKGFDIPLGQRLAMKRTAETSADKEPPLKKSLSCAFTDDDDEDWNVSTQAAKTRKGVSSVEVSLILVGQDELNCSHSSGNSSPSLDPLHSPGPDL